MNELLKNLKPGDKIYTSIKHVSKSGMTRDISLNIVVDNKIRDITWMVAELLDYKIKNYGVRIQGCGMDMAFALVYELGRKLFPDGFGVPCYKCGTRPKSKDHAVILTTQPSCTKTDDGMHSIYGRNGNKSGWDNDGGYALKKETL